MGRSGWHLSDDPGGKRMKFRVYIRAQEGTGGKRNIIGIFIRLLEVRKTWWGPEKIGGVTAGAVG